MRLSTKFSSPLGLCKGMRRPRKSVIQGSFSSSRSSSPSDSASNFRCSSFARSPSSSSHCPQLSSIQDRKGWSKLRASGSLKLGTPHWPEKPSSSQGRGELHPTHPSISSRHRKPKPPICAPRAIHHDPASNRSTCLVCKRYGAMPRPTG